MLRLSLLCLMVLAACQTSPNPQGHVPGAQVANILVSNRASYAVTEFYLVPDGYKGWGENALRQSVLPGERGYMLMPHDVEICLWSVRAVFADGSVEVQRGLDFCAKQQLDLHGG